VQVYGIISCAVSFWTPASVMAVAYVRIYRVAKRQQEQIYSLTYSVGQCIVNIDQVITLFRLLELSSHEYDRITYEPTGT